MWDEARLLNREHRNGSNLFSFFFHHFLRRHTSFFSPSFFFSLALFSNGLLMRLLDDHPRMLFSLGTLNGDVAASIPRSLSFPCYFLILNPPPPPLSHPFFFFSPPLAPRSHFLSLSSQQGLGLAHRFNIDLATLQLRGLSILPLWVQRNIMSLLNNGFVLFFFCLGTKHKDFRYTPVSLVSLIFPQIWLLSLLISWISSS